jgi:YD repeat-containing protein
MKKLMFFLAAVVFSTMLHAQDKKVTEIKTTDLPKEVTTFITKNMPGAKITRAGKVDEKGVISYLAVLERQGTKHAYQFDKEGKLIGKADNMNLQSAGKAAPAGTVTDPAKSAPQAKPPVKTGTSTEAPKK